MAGFDLQFARKTTLSAQMLASEVTSATLSSAVFTNFVNQPLVIDYDNPSKAEIIICTVTGTAISAITRGVDGTSAVQHEIGAKIGMQLVPTHYSDLKPLIGYAEVTANQTSITTITDLTNLSVAVTVPVSGRKIRITGKVQVVADAAGREATLSIRESSTTANYCIAVTSDAYSTTMIAQYIGTATAGAHTYKLSLAATAGSVTMQAAATYPAFILVEYI